MKFLLVWFLVGILEVPFSRGDQSRWRVGGYTYSKPLPQEIMVDAVNYIGLVLLQAHNQNNENNIALSPYGATSVLVALGEGVQGPALEEILRATLLPLDVSVTRIGLRDIHRHLKSYFIPQEGFLAGLTFSHENVTLKSSYEDVLRFYGYDVDSFNNPLYPDPYTSTTTDSATSSSESSTISSNQADHSLSTTFPSLSTIENENDFTNAQASTLPTTIPTNIVNTTNVATAVTSSTTTTTQSTTTTATTLFTTQQQTTTVQPFTATEINIRSTTTEPTVTTPTSITETTQPTTETTIFTPRISTIIDSTTKKTTSSDTETTTPFIQTTTLRPTSVTLNIIPSTLGNAENPSRTTTTVTHSVLTDGSISINFEPSTVASTTNFVTSTVPTTISNSSGISVTQSGILSTTLDTNTNYQASSVAVTLIPSTVNPTDVETTILSTTENTITDNIPVAGDLPTGFGINTAQTSFVSTTDSSVTVTVEPSTTGNENTETTISSVREIATDTIPPAGSLTSFEMYASSSTVNPTTNSSPTISLKLNITENHKDKSVTVSTPLNTATNNILPEADLPTSIEVGITPTTITPKSANLSVSRTDKQDINQATNRGSSFPRFKDDTELVSMLQTENKLSAIHMIEEMNFTIPNHSKSTLDIDKLIKNSSTTTSNHKTVVSTTKYNDKSELDILNISGNNDDSDVITSKKSLSTKTYSFNNTRENISTDKIDPIFSERTNLSKISLEEILTEKNNSSEQKSPNGKIRVTRSVIDYIIARYHDNSAQPPSSSGYHPIKPTTFAVNGKIREQNISFMTYDTVLPYRYISYLNAMALSFPLDSTKYYLLLLLPVDEMGIDSLINNMMSTTLKQIIYNLQPTRVKATIPSFMLKGYVVLTPTLQKLGIRQIFEPRHADFSRMTDDKDIYVTNIEQAVTVTIRNYVDPATLQQNNNHFKRRGPVHFLADHPFLYFVMDSQIHVALMAGKIINPLNSRIR